MDKTVPPPAAYLLNWIGSIEAPRGYDVIFGNNQDKLTKPITQMSVDELIENQAGFTKAFRSSASGRYQFMRATLQDLKRELRLRGTQIMNPNLQDRLGYHLLRRRGYDAWVKGEMSDEEFALNIAKEWASLPVLRDMQGHTRRVKRGQSYYAGDSLNKSLVKPEKVEQALREAREQTAPPTPTPVPVERTFSKEQLLAALSRPDVQAAILAAVLSGMEDDK